MPPIRLPFQSDGVPGREAARDRREEPKDIIQAEARDRQRLPREDQHEQAVEDERERREESVPVGVPRERELQHALLGGGGGLGRLDRLRRLQPLQRWSEPRLRGRRLPRTRLAGHGVPNCTCGWEGWCQQTWYVHIKDGTRSPNPE